MAHVDALSRCHESTDESYTDASVAEEAEAYVNCRLVAAADEEETSFHIQVAQSRDLIILNLRERLEKETVTGFKLMNGLVFKDITPDRPQLYVPAEMEDNVIRMAHEAIGHLAVDKTLGRLSAHYWFPTMKAKISQFISNCIICIMHLYQRRFLHGRHRRYAQS